MSRIDCLSRFPSYRARVDVPIFELFAASVSQPINTSARVSILTSNDVGICMDDEYTTAYRGL